MSEHKNPSLESLEQRLLLSSDLSVSQILSQANNLNIPKLGVVAVKGAIQRRGSSEFYKITPRAEVVLAAKMRSLAASLSGKLQVLDWRGQPVAAQAGYDINAVKLRLEAGRDYFVRAAAVDGTTGRYRLRLASAPLDNVGDTIETADAVALDERGSRLINGVINSGSDVDFFAFQASRTGEMQVTMNHRRYGSSFPCQLAAYDANGNLLAQDRMDSTGGSALSLNVTAGQRYYIRAASTSGYRGFYALQIATAGGDEVVVIPDADGELAPGADVTADVLRIDGQDVLVILGTDGNDRIVLSGGSGSATLTAGGSSSRIDQSFDAIHVYGFGGKDTIRLTHSVNVAAMIDGGDGIDSIFAAGTRADMILGGAGNDLIVSIGSGSDQVYGDDGLDSLWLDSTDLLKDGSAAESAAGAVHRVSKFYQPWTGNASSADYVSLELAGQNLRDPSIRGWANGYADFSDVPLFVDGTQYDDISQGGVGDCYYLATLASLADVQPALLQQGITALGDGTYAVRFYSGGRETYVRVDAQLPVNFGRNLAFAGLGNDGELWVPLMEKAYAFIRFGENSYASLNGGWMSTVFEELTNKATDLKWTSDPAGELAQYMESHLLSGHGVTLGSNSNASGPVIGGHAYSVRSVNRTASGTTVTVYNPWGIDGGTASGSANDGLVTLTMAQVQKYFFATVVGML